MEIILWILIIALFILSFIGLFYPIIPSVLVIWAGVFIYFFFISSEAISWWTWGSFIFLTVVLFIVDYIANLYFVKRYGGSTWGMRMATIGVIIGCFIMPPFGILFVPFILVLLTELLQNKAINESFKIAFGTFIAFLSSTIAKAMLQLCMIIIFLFDILL